MLREKLNVRIDDNDSDDDIINVWLYGKGSYNNLQVSGVAFHPSHLH
jgi:hypothetical protein